MLLLQDFNKNKHIKFYNNLIFQYILNKFDWLKMYCEVNLVLDRTNYSHYVYPSKYYIIWCSTKTEIQKYDLVLWLSNKMFVLNSTIKRKWDSKKCVRAHSLKLSSVNITFTLIMDPVRESQAIGIGLLLFLIVRSHATHHTHSSRTLK